MLHRMKTPCCYAAAITAATLAGKASAFDGHAEAPVEPAEHPIVQFLKEGKVSVDLRFRYEFADDAALAGDSNAFTLRTRLGYTTSKLNGFQAMVELEDNRAADATQYNDGPGPGTAGGAVIADPVENELNRLWVSYDFSEISEGLNLTAKVGRQRIIFDDARFIGNVGWRQLEQTYDAARLDYKPSEDLAATYVYVNDVNRIFGDDSGVDFASDSHLLNVAYTGLDIGKIVGFAYILDLGNAGAGAANSSQTYGLRLTGSADLSDALALDYAGSFAFQSDYADNPTGYDAVYVAAEGKLKFKETAGGFVGAGFELLGSDDGTIGFSTPLATLHKFNGFADDFLATPAGGLRDYYVTAGTNVPGIDAKFLATYHYFTGDDQNVYLGSEIDFVLVKKLNEKMSVLAKYAFFEGDEAGRNDVERFSLQLDIKF